MRVDFVHLNHYGVKQLLSWDFRNLDKLFILIKSEKNNLLLAESDCEELFAKFDPNKIVCILYKGPGRDYKRIPKSVLSHLSVINADEAYTTLEYNFVKEEGWLQCWREDLINVIFVSDPNMFDEYRYLIHSSYKGEAILIGPKLFWAMRLTETKSKITAVWTPSGNLKIAPTQCLELIGTKVIICN